MNGNNIFISYGHNVHDGVVRRLAEDLRQENFHVFFDVDYLGQGDWEKTIDDHICDCKYFIFMVSRRSVSGDGYCLNELCRAGETGAVIIPVRLDDSLVPLSINKYFRLSLIESMTPDGELLAPKYHEFLMTLVGLLQGKTAPAFSDSAIRLRNTLKPISSKEDLDKAYRSFCGREAAFVYLPVTGDFCYALKGQGCFLDNRKIRMDAGKAHQDGILLISDYYDGISIPFERQFALVRAMQPVFLKTRHFGAACYDFVSLVKSNAAAYITYYHCLWDIAPGLLLVAEAGGVYANLAADGFSYPETGIAVANNEENLSLIREAYRRLS